MIKRNEFAPVRMAKKGQKKETWLMRAILFALAGLGFLFGGAVIGEAKNAIHEIEALIGFLIGTVGFGCGAIVVAIRRHGREQLAAIQYSNAVIREINARDQRAAERRGEG